MGGRLKNKLKGIFDRFGRKAALSEVAKAEMEKQIEGAKREICNHAAALFALMTPGACITINLKPSAIVPANGKPFPGGVIMLFKPANTDAFNITVGPGQAPPAPPPMG